MFNNFFPQRRLLITLLLIKISMFYKLQTRIVYNKHI